MHWIEISPTTATGAPEQYFDHEGTEIFCVMLERKGGPGDDQIPRRVIGLGENRVQARERAWEASVRAERA
ncbi:MAG TPA: hypothetical protein VH593_26800 [Ktedonobacteraceae bacterium]